MEQTKRLEYIDALRGFSMILVIYFHIPSYCLGNAYIGFNDVLEWVRMPLFFFISGFVFYKVGRVWDNTTIRSMLKKKFMVQIIPTIVFMLLFLFLFDYFDVSALGSDKKGFWYTIVLFEYFVIYILAEASLNQKNSHKGELRVMILVLFISILSFFYAKYYNRYSGELGNLKTILGFFSFVKLRHFVFFWFGTIIRKHFSTFIRLSDQRYIMLTLILLYIAMTLFPVVYHTPGLEYPAYLISGITLTVILFTFFRKNEHLLTKEKWPGKSLQFIGRRTLDIYLLHYFFLPYQQLQDFGAKLIQYDNKALEVVIILILTLCIIAISLAASSIIRLSPFLAHYLFGAKSKNYEA